MVNIQITSISEIELQIISLAFVSVYLVTFFFQFIFYKFKRPFIFFPNYQKITLIKTDDEKEFSISLNGVFNAEFCSL